MAERIEQGGWRGALRQPPISGSWMERLRRFRKMLGEVFYGATGYEFERQAQHVRADLENLFVFMVMGDIIGVPIMPPYYSLRLVPYLAEFVPIWRRRVLRERSPFESEDYDMHGL